jgi:hypothetical protein
MMRDLLYEQTCQSHPDITWTILKLLESKTLEQEKDVRKTSFNDRNTGFLAIQITPQ